MEQWVVAALAAWVVWAEIRAALAERRHAAERRELCARLQAGTIERYDAHTARVQGSGFRGQSNGGSGRGERPRTPAAPALAPESESVAEARLRFDRLMDDQGNGRESGVGGRVSGPATAG